jgi:hypothetical protein
MQFLKTNFSVIVMMTLTTVVNLNAQKVDLDPWRYTVVSRHLPEMVLDKSYNTYDVKVQTSGSFKDNISDDQIVSKTNVEGWKRVNTQGHVTITVAFANFMVDKTGVSERVEEVKDKEGKVTSRNYYYTPYMVYNYQGSYDAVTYKSEKIRSLNLSESTTWKGTETSSAKEAQDYINNNRQTLRDNIIRSSVESRVNALTRDFTLNFGYMTTKSNDLVYLLDSKKHPEFEGHQKVIKSLKEELITLKATESLDRMKAIFAPHIAYLEETITKYNKDEKSDRKMRYAAYYALGKISYWLDEPDKTIKYGELLIANKYDEKDGKELIEWGKSLKKDFERTKLTTRYFAIDTEKFEAPVMNK